jgi:hypothetical protein
MSQTKIIGSLADNERKKKEFRSCNCKRSNCLKVTNNASTVFTSILYVYILVYIFVFICYNSCTVSVLPMHFTAFLESVTAITAKIIMRTRYIAGPQLNIP